MDETKNKSFWVKDNVPLTIILWGALPWIMIGVEVKDRTNSWIKAIISSFFSLILIFLIYGQVSNENNETRINYLEDQIMKLENENKNLIRSSDTPIAEDEDKSPLPSTDEKKEEKKVELVECIFGAGNYTCGDDFEPGKYNIVAIEGSSGNVMTPGLLIGGINEIMGLDESWATKEIKNIEFKKNTVLEIRGITIKLVPVK